MADLVLVMGEGSAHGACRDHRMLVCQSSIEIKSLDIRVLLAGSLRIRCVTSS